MQDDQSGGGEGRVAWVVKGMEEAVVWSGWLVVDCDGRVAVIRV